MKISRVCVRVQAALSEKIESPGNVMLRCELRGVETKPQDSNADETNASGGVIGQTVFFELVKKTGELAGVTVRDPGGVGIEFHFANWQADPPIDDSLFHFHAPPGVAIVNGELPAGNVGINP